MSIPGIYLAIIGLGISSIAGIIGIFNLFGISIEPFYLLFSITTGAVISLIGMYLQYKESETIRIKIDFKKDEESGFFVFKVPYGLYRKSHPIIDIQYENGNSGTWECLIRPKEIGKDGTIVFSSKRTT